MGAVARHRILMLAALILSIAGAIDAAFGQIWDLFAILSAVAVVIAAEYALAPSIPIKLRPDIERWLRDRSAVEGEPIDAIVTRAFATYREHLMPGAGSAGPPDPNDVEPDAR